MQIQMKNAPWPLALGVLATLIALIAFVALLRLKSLADITEQQVAASNTLPAIGTFEVLDGPTLDDVTLLGFTPNEATTRNLIVRGTVTDLNGIADLDSVYVYVHRTDKMGLPVGQQQPISCSSDKNDCYYAETAVFTQINPTTASFEVTIPVANYADATDYVDAPGTDWTALALVYDNSAVFNFNSAAFEVNSLAAYNLLASLNDAVVNYGTLALGAYSGERVIRFYNSGNRDLTSLVKADGAMTSNIPGFDVISAGDVHFSTLGLNETTYGDMDPISTSDSPLAICLPQQTVDGPGGIPSRPSYLELKVPNVGVNGIYTNTLTYTAVATTDCPTATPILDCVNHPYDPECLNQPELPAGWSSGASAPDIFAYSAGVIHNGKAYVFGGTTANQTDGLLMSYDTQTNAWDTDMASVPSDWRAFHSAVDYGNKLWVFGGMWSDPLDSLKAYDYIADSWSTMQPDTGHPRILHSAVVYDNKMYVFGGEDNGTVSSDMRVYDFTANTWSSGTGDPGHEREQHTAVVYNDKMYIYGGTDDQSAIKNTMRVYDFVADSWADLAENNAGLPRTLASAHVINGKMYVFGGQNSDGLALSDLLVYDIASNTWSTGIADTDHENFAYVSGLYDGKIYILGGTDSQSVFDTVRIYDSAP